MATVEIYQDDSDNKEWRWTVTAGETAIGKSSEGFNSKSYAQNNLKSFPSFCLPADVKVASEDPENSKRPLSFYQDTSDVPQWRWRVKAGNGFITHASVRGWPTRQEAVDNVAGLNSAVKVWDDAG